MFIKIELPWLTHNINCKKRKDNTRNEDGKTFRLRRLLRWWSSWHMILILDIDNELLGISCTTDYYLWNGTIQKCITIECITLGKFSHYYNHSDLTHVQRIYSHSTETFVSSNSFCRKPEWWLEYGLTLRLRSQNIFKIVTLLAT